MLTVVKGKFRNGRVELDQDPGVVDETIVLVTFLNPTLESIIPLKREPIRFGMLADPSRQMSTEEDFRIAEHVDNRWNHD